MPARAAVPGRGREPIIEPQPHQFVIGGMKAHLVDAMPVAVEAVEHGGLAVRLDAPFDHLGRTAALPQRRQSLGMAARTSLRHRIDERAVAAEQVHILERRRSEEHTSELQALMRISYAV